MNIQKIRQFNRDLTTYLGVYDRNLFDLHYPMFALRIILEIDNHPGVSAKQLIDSLNIDKGYLSRIINQLVKDGQLQRKQDPHDHRLWDLFLTNHGHHLAEVINQRSDVRVAKLIVQLPNEKLTQVFESIELLQGALNQVKEEK